MPKFATQSTVPYTPQQLYDLVADVQAYPEFIPFCSQIVIHEQTAEHMLVDMHIGYKGFVNMFQSVVTLSSPRALKMETPQQALDKMHSQWQFIPVDDNSTIAIFEITIIPDSFLKRVALEPMIDKLGEIMMAAFLDRAKAIYHD